MSFDKRWEKNADPTAYEKVKEVIRPSEPLKSRLVDSVKQIEQENQRLTLAAQRFQERDKMIFNKVVEAYTSHDTARAKIYANELAEVRKMQRMIFSAKLALEQISLRMRTVTELGDVAATLMPVVSVLGELRGGIASINPETERGLSDIGELINGMFVDSGALTETSISFDSVSSDSANILSEAQAVTEARMGDTFPELPKGEMDQLSGGEEDRK
ncbi:MAG: Snf7 family protein [Candidatus Bathyarchaeota archaeon]|nr:Snf7 family protein [Candidatus Bathyarchaeota archaeon]